MSGTLLLFFFLGKKKPSHQPETWKTARKRREPERTISLVFVARLAAGAHGD